MKGGDKKEPPLNETKLWSELKEEAIQKFYQINIENNNTGASVIYDQSITPKHH